MPEAPKPLRIFLSYAHADVISVRKLHRYLREKGFDVWFDKENLVPGHDWQLEIERGLSRSDVIIICLSQAAVSAEGFVQREFRFALDRALEMPEGRIFLIPVRLQACEAPTRLNRYHWVDLFEREGYSRLMRGLKHCAEQLARARVDESQPLGNIPDPDTYWGDSISAGQDISGSAIIVGNNNVIHMPPTSVAQDDAAKREKQTAEDERQAREKAEAQRIAQERLAAEEAEKERLAKVTAENERVARENEQAKRTAAQKTEDERKAREKHERAQRARAQTWANLKTPALLLGGLLLIGVGCVALGLLAPYLTPGFTVPTATPEIFATETPQTTETLPLATFTSLPPTDIPTLIPSLTPTPAAGDVIVSEKDGMNLRYVPAGSFIMGSDNGESDEKPAHEVTLDAFWIDETEVTNKMYALCVKENKCQPPGNKLSYKRESYYDDPLYADYPVIYVSWNDATAHCAWAGRKLPSEAQWEKAARGADQRTYPWGNDAPNKDLLNYNQNVGDTSKVDLYPNGKSPYGAYDMAGNVWEWVNDWYDATYYASALASNPPGPVSGQYRALRGGSWYVYRYYVRSAVRNNGTPNSSSFNIGFRCALSP